MELRKYIREEFKRVEKLDNDYGNFYNAMMYDGFDLTLFNDLTVKSVESHGGEGQGDEYYEVYSFSNGDKTEYVKFNGWYASYHGAELTEWSFVEPEEVTITRYKFVERG